MQFLQLVFLVGGPAGSMEAGRQVEVAKRILSAKNVPYIAAPVIQDIHSWTRQGIGGLQSVVLRYQNLMEQLIRFLLGGLVGEDIYLIPEQVQGLIGRLKCGFLCGKHLQLNAVQQLCFTGFPQGKHGNSCFAECTPIAPQIPSGIKRPRLQR